MEYIGPKITGTVKERYLSGPALARLNSSRRFYINTYWFKYVMVVVLMQSDVSEEAIKSETQVNDDKKCEFEKSLERNAPRTNFFYLNINVVATGIVKKYMCRRSRDGKVGDRKF